MPKIITGQFINPITKRPVSSGKLLLTLQSDSEDDINVGIPIAAVGTMTEAEKEDFKWSHGSYTFTLDAEGRISPEAEILGNDELSGDTWYHAQVSNSLPYPDKFHWAQLMRITGDSPIDITTIVPKDFVPEPEPESEIQRIPPLPPKRIVGANYVGFYGGTIYPSGDGDSMTIAESEGRYPFYVPFKAVVRRAAIFVIVPRSGRSVMVGLRNAVTDERVCDVAIDASKQGVSSAFLDETKILNPGEYAMSWSVDSFSPTLKVRSINKTGLEGTTPIGPMVYFSS